MNETVRPDLADAIDLTVVVVTYNSVRHVEPLLRTLHCELAAMRAEVVLVDNASHDGTADLVEDHHAWVRVLRSPVNLGFAAGNNLGVRHARGRMLLLLNPDALPRRGCVRRGLELMAAHPEVGLAGARLLDPAGRAQPSARMDPTPLQEFFVLSGLAARFARSRLFGRLDRGWADPSEPAEVDWVPGAFALIRREVFESLGGFDERYFLYYEEVDLCRRLRARGLRVMYWPELEVRHVGGASARTVTGQRVARSGSQLTLWRARSGLMYFRAHHGAVAAWIVNRVERGWHALRGLKARLRGDGERAEESRGQRWLLARAWDDTLGGRVSPPRPW